MSSVKDLSDADLRAELINLGFAAGPVTASTRKIYEKKLETIRNNAPAAKGKSTSAVVEKPTLAKTITYQPPSPAAVASAGKKKAQVFDSSDEELDLTVSSFVESPRPVARPAAKKTAPPPPQSADRSLLPPPRPAVGHSSSGGVALKRTPTPPRAVRTAARTTPLSNEPIVPAGGRGRHEISSSSGLGGAVFTPSNSFAASFDRSAVIGGGVKTLPAFQQPPPQAADDEDDDHMETSRVVPRFRPSGNFSTSNTGLSTSGGRRSSGFGSSFTSPYRASPADVYSAKYWAPTAAGGSSMDRLRRISKGAWEFFSPPSMDDSSNSLRGSHNAKSFSGIGKYSPNTSRLSVGKSVKVGQSAGNGGGGGSAVAYCLVGLAAVGSVAVAGYTWKTHPEAIKHGVDATVGFATTTFNYFYAFLIVPLVILIGVGLLAGAAYKFNQFREGRKKERQERLLTLVDRITDIIRDNESEGIAELHVRDILLPPTKRTNDDWALWKDAAKFINLEDSRVRTELRMVNGDECNVWVWVPITKQK